MLNMRFQSTFGASMRALGVLLFFVLAATPAQAANRLSCASLPGLMQRFLEEHVAYKDRTGELADRLVARYMERLDGSKSNLLESEAKALRAELKRRVTEIEGGNCKVLLDVKARQLAWVKDTEAYVRKAMAEKGLKIDRSIELRIDPDERGRPKTAEARDALRRKLVHWQLASYVSAGTELEEAKKKLIHRYELITKRVNELTEADVYSGFLDAFATALDPHSSYFSADALEDFRIAMNLSLEGIGAVLSQRDGYTTVQEVVSGGAADRQGQLKAKDKIVAVTQVPDGEPVDVIDMSLRNVVRMIRGKKGTLVKLTVLRQGKKTQTLNITIKRDKIDLGERAAKLRWESSEVKGRKLKLAVLELPSFYGGRGPGARRCTDDMKKLLREAKAGKADGLLLDLSRNSGGLLEAAVDISGYFIKTGTVVGVDGPSGQTLLKDTDPGVEYDGPLVVLVSRASASASEILVGALKDYGRAVVVGDDHTFGKGTVQVVVNLPVGFGALKVTTALFFRPGGVSTQSKGVTSDIVVPSALNRDDFGEAKQTYALPNRSIPDFKSHVGQIGKSWSPVPPGRIGPLAKASAKRQKGSKEFRELAKDLEKAKKDKGIVKLAEILEDKDKDKGDEEPDAKKKDDEKLTPQAEEALKILGDLVTG